MTTRIQYSKIKIIIIIIGGHWDPNEDKEEWMRKLKPYKIKLKCPTVACWHQQAAIDSVRTIPFKYYVLKFLKSALVGSIKKSNYKLCFVAFYMHFIMRKCKLI